MIHLIIISGLYTNYCGYLKKAATNTPLLGPESFCGLSKMLLEQRVRTKTSEKFNLSPKKDKKRLPDRTVTVVITVEVPLKLQNTSKG